MKNFTKNLLLGGLVVSAIIGSYFVGKSFGSHNEVTNAKAEKIEAQKNDLSATKVGNEDKNVVVAKNSNKTVIKIITDQEPFHMKFIEEHFKNKNVELKITYVDEGLFEKAKNGDYDIIITKDSSEIIKAKQDHLLKKIDPVILAKVPNRYKDKDGYWIIYSLRIRGFFVSNEMVEDGDVPYTYEELADPKYKGEICIRKLTHHYNLELFAQLYQKWGEEKFRKWLKGFISNLATTPSGNDRAQVQKIYNDECEMSIGNSYYLGLMRHNPLQNKWANNVKFVVPDQKNGGAIALYSAAGTLKTTHLSNKVLDEFYEYLISDKAQKLNSELSYEYPIYPKDTSKESATYGKFQGISYANGSIKIADVNQDKLYENRVKVLKIIKEVEEELK